MNSVFYSLARVGYCLLLMAAWLSSRAQVINPVPSNPSLYVAPPTIYFIEVQKDGKVVLVGDFTQFTGLEQKPLIRLNVDGRLDETFHPPQLPVASYYQGISAILMQPDDKLLVGLQSSNGIVRLNADGTLDRTFQLSPVQNQGYDVRIDTMALQSDGMIVAGGYFNTIGTNFSGGIARFNSDGSFDSTFHPHFTLQGTAGSVQSILNQSNGKIVVNGYFDEVDGVSYNGIARLNSDGSIDRSFINLTNSYLYTQLFDIQADGKLLVSSSLGLMRLMPDGGIDYRFNPGLGISGTNRYLLSARFTKDGDLLIFGNFDLYDDQWRRSLARINEDGSLDQTFDAHLTKTVRARTPDIMVSTVKTLADGSFLVAGSFTDVQGKSKTALARFTGDGKVDENFNAFQPILREPSLTSDSFYQVRIVGERWRPYVVEASDDLKAWQPLRNVIITDFPLYFIDLRQQSGQNYYRIRSL
jgi:uncharacterized delta-60 repeat protein